MGKLATIVERALMPDNEEEMGNIEQEIHVALEKHEHLTIQPINLP